MQDKPTPPTSRDRSRAPQLRALGRAVRETRKGQKISQEELGFRSTLHRNYIGHLERGTLNPGFLVLVRLMAGLRIKLSDFIVIYERNASELTRSLADAAT